MWTGIGIGSSAIAQGAIVNRYYVASGFAFSQIPDCRFSTVGAQEKEKKLHMRKEGQLGRYIICRLRRNIAHDHPDRSEKEITVERQLESTSQE